jgi:pilus assembly protein CpaB
MTALFGVLVAGGSVFYASTLSTNPIISAAAEAAPSQATNMVDVYVAKSDIPFGGEITLETLTVQGWPAEAVPFGAITDPYLIMGDGTASRRAKRHISQGELLLPEKMSEFGEVISIGQKLGANTRAVAIQVDAVTGVAGFVAPGDRVDIVLTQGMGESLSSFTILQDVSVIGVDQAADADAVRESIARTITVEVSARDGQKLALARNAGQLSLTLRSLDNATNETLGPVTLADVLGVEQAAPVVVTPAPVVAAPHQITVRRGSAETVISLDPATSSSGP